jgi:hypothetical protein
MQKHILTVRHKTTGKLILRAFFTDFGSKKQAEVAARAVLRANPDRCRCEIAAG